MLVRFIKLVPLLMALSCASIAQTPGEPLRLTLHDAITRGLKANLGVLIADTRVAEARGTAERRQSALFPRVRFDAPAVVQSRSLQAMGITVPGLPDVVGPFSTYEARFSAEQSVFDLTAVHNVRAARQSESALKLDYQDVRDSVVRQIAALYLTAQSAHAQAAAAAVRVESAQALYKLASDQRDAGVATGIDVLRSQVRLASERQGLVQARNAAAEALLALARNIGLSPGTSIELADPLNASQVAVPSAEAALTSALNERQDYLSLLKQRDAFAEQLRASKARSLPRLAVGGNYGAIGRTLSNMNGTGAAQLSLSFTVFDRDRQGEQQEINARIQRVERQAADLKLGIEQDIRQALLRLESATEEVTVAVAGLDLAQKELDLAKLRFQSGVTNNIEVVNAQDSVARAQQNHIVALTRHADARIALARALGNTEATYSHYLGVH